MLTTFPSIKEWEENAALCPVEYDATVIPSYEKAMLLLHNFEYPDAAELFIETQKTNPDYVMAYWGEAMTYDHPVWGDLDVDKARAALRKLGSSPEERIAKGKTELEKDFIRAVEILFGEGSKPDRQKKYSQFMGNVYNKYPGNIEVASFYCLSLLGNKEGWNKWEDLNVKAAAIAEDILRLKPDHPGALHYLVHANDHPLHAKDGLSAANKYGKVASYAGHALHMPSHIYVALGMWDNVVASNEVSWQASIDRKNRKSLNNDNYSYHSHLWLEYGYLQQGRFERAKELLNNQLKYATELSSIPARVHLIQMKGHYLVETNDWSSPIADVEIKTDDLHLLVRQNYSMIEAYKFLQKKEANKLETLISDFEKELAQESQLQKSNENMTICGVTRFAKAIPSKTDIERGTQFLNQFKAMRAWMKNDLTGAEEFLKQAMPSEGTVVVGPPFAIVPPHELYGNFLLTTGHPREAFAEFEKSLMASPNRTMALRGQLKAARALKDTNLENKVRTLLDKNLKSSDVIARKDF
jgi:tetratricopeptide (TPR) repeat protein